MYARTVISSRPILTAFAMIILGLLLGVLKAGTVAVRRRGEKQEYLLMILQILVLVCSGSLLTFLEWKLIVRVLR
jgi:hypothetical protein